MLADQSKGGPPDRQETVAEISLYRRLGLSTTGIEVRRELSPRKNPARAGFASTRSGGRRLAARGRGASAGRLRCDGLQPGHAARNFLKLSDGHNPGFRRRNEPA